MRSIPLLVFAVSCAAPLHAQQHPGAPVPSKNPVIATPVPPAKRTAVESRKKKWTREAQRRAHRRAILEANRRRHGL